MKNFITANTYSCLEVNFHGLIILMHLFKEKGWESNFMPNLFNSQSCERFFGLIRSMTTVFSTITQCSFKEFLERIYRVLLLEESEKTLAEKFNYIFPGSKPKSKPHVQVSLPNQQEMFEVISKAKMKAIQICQDIFEEEIREEDCRCQLIGNYRSFHVSVTL